MYLLAFVETDWQQELLKRLDALADKLGTTSQYLWTVMVKQGRIEGIADLCLALFFLGVALYGWHLRKKSYAITIPADSYNKDWPPEKVALLTCGVIMTIAAGGISMGSFYYGIQELLNPEYYALRKLFETLAGR